MIKVRGYCRFFDFLDVNENIGKEIKTIVITDTTEQTYFILLYSHSGHTGFVYVKAVKNKSGEKVIEKVTIRDYSGYFAGYLEIYNRVEGMSKEMTTNLGDI